MHTIYCSVVTLKGRAITNLQVASTATVQQLYAQISNAGNIDMQHVNVICGARYLTEMNLTLEQAGLLRNNGATGSVELRVVSR